MKKTGIASIMLLALASVGTAQLSAATPAAGEDITQAQVKQLKASAHSPDQYRTLAHYYETRQEFYQRQAADAKKQWDELSQNNGGPAAKYPRPVDSAKNLYVYYVSKASQAATEYAKYNSMAEPGVMASNR
jgi:hypothetical protein